MAQPTPYNPSTDFSDSYGSSQDSDLDVEFENIEQTLDETLTNLALIQRDDGVLRNESVGRDQLKTEVVAGINTPADWAASTDYSVRDSVFYDNVWYWATVAHTSSSSFATDSDNWQLLLDFEEVASPAAVAAAAAAAVSEANAATYASDAADAASDAANFASDAATVVSSLNLAGMRMFTANNLI